PSTAAEAGRPAFSVEDAVAGWFSATLAVPLPLPLPPAARVPAELLRVADDVARCRVGRRRRSGGVDDVRDGAHAAERHGEQIVPRHSGRAGRGERIGRTDSRIDVEVAIAAQAPAAERGDVAG